MTDLSMTRVTTENTVNGVDVCGSDDVFVEDLRKSPAAAAADDDESVASSVLRRSYLSSPTISYTTPMAVIAMRQQV
jgi:hypothetical protein